MLLLIDNYDSFTHNLARYFTELGEVVEVVRNDALTVEQLVDKPFDYLVISPGPGNPDAAGVSMQAVQQFAGRLPILGVCLGMQAIAQSYGGQVVHAKAVMHGKTSRCFHDNGHLFKGVANPFKVARYHSLVVDQASMPDDFLIAAWTGEQDRVDEVMAIEHRTLPIFGVQFHPESVASEFGHELLQQFLRSAA